MRAADFFGWALLMGSFILWVLTADLGWIDVPAHSAFAGWRVSALALPLPGLAVGIGLLLLRTGDSPSAHLGVSPGHALVALLTILLGVALLAGIQAHEVGAAQAAALMILGTVTLIVAQAALEAIRRDEGFDIETHWGGLGGGFGGFRVSRSLLLVGLLVIFAGAVITATLQAAAAPGGGDQTASVQPRKDAHAK